MDDTVADHVRASTAATGVSERLTDPTALLEAARLLAAARD